MPTPAIQTLINDAQQVLNLDSISAVRSVVAVSLANANTGTPLNPNLTTQQLWNEFYQVVTRSKSDIESIIANQLMKFLYSPPAPGGVGADKQVIFNDGGVLAGDADFLWNKTTNLLTVTGSATISGNLTVDTNTLFVDSANNRVGIGTATPSAALDVNGASNLNGNVTIANAGNPFGTLFVTGSALELQANSNSTNGLSLKTTSTTPIIFSVNSAEAMRLNSTGLGVGGSPTRKLSIVGSGATYANINSGDNTSLVGLLLGGTSTPSAGQLIYDNTANSLSLFTSGSSRFLIDSSGNVGIGVTPSAWNNTYNVLDIGQNGSISGRTSTNNSVDIVSNGFRNSGGTWVYKLATSNAASRYLIDGATGGHLWYSGAAGTAGNTIAGFSTATMTLDASGRLILLASTTTPATLSTNGQLTFTATSDTNLRFSYRGSDGVTRVANITLA